MQLKAETKSDASTQKSDNVLSTKDHAWIGGKTLESKKKISHQNEISQIYVKLILSYHLV